MTDRNLDGLVSVVDNANPAAAQNIRQTIFSEANGQNLPVDWSLNNYVWYPWYNTLKSEDLYTRLSELNVPILEIYEFQPATDLAMYINLLRRAIDVARNIGTGDAGIGEVLTRIGEALGTQIGNAIGGVVNANSVNAIRDNFRIGNEFYLGISDGKYLSRFELPCYNDLIWNANGGSGWKRMGVVERYLGVIGSALSNTGLDAPAKPVFEANNTPVPSVNARFYLFNGHIEAALANLKLLYSLLPGGYWMQDAYYQRGSNLYTVRFENYYQYQLCSMDAKVSMKGKSRRPPQRVLDEFKSITMLPDIFEVDITFTSILPNTLNQFFAPYFPAFQEIAVGQGRSVFSPFGNLLEELFPPPPPTPSPTTP